MIVLQVRRLLLPREVHLFFIRVQKASEQFEAHLSLLLVLDLLPHAIRNVKLFFLRLLSVRFSPLVFLLECLLLDLVLLLEQQLLIPFVVLLDLLLDFVHAYVFLDALALLELIILELQVIYVLLRVPRLHLLDQILHLLVDHLVVEQLVPLLLAHLLQ